MRIINRTQFTLLASAICALMFNTVSGPVLAQSADQLKFPYQAIVLHDEATIHSGPGQVHYATEQLMQGAIVEVYREDPGGWCAIRPVEGSFSLVPEATLEIVEAGVGRILENGTQAWVGTKLGPVDKPLWQVKLKKGELVEVLGQVSWPSPEGHSTIWYQVSPPAGEFRWVRMSDIQLPTDISKVTSIDPQETHTGSPTNPSRVVRSLNEILQTSPKIDFNTTSNEEFAIGDGTQNNVQQATLQIEQPASRGQGAGSSFNINRGWRLATRPIGSNESNLGAIARDFGSGITSDGTRNNGMAENFWIRDGFNGQTSFGSPPANEFMRVASADLLGPNLAQHLDLARDQNGLSGTGSQFSIQSTGQSQRTLSRSVSDLELQLTHEMIKNDPSHWRLEDLELAANAIYRTSQNSTERLLAEKYLTKVSNCKEIRAGFRADVGATMMTATGPSKRPIGTGVNPDVELGTTYDAHGWLTELIRDGGNSQSGYALQDASGKITHHIAPAPGMNLRRYLKSRVGVIGQRGYHTELKLDHVTAHRIIELEKPKLTFRR